MNRSSLIPAILLLASLLASCAGPPPAPVGDRGGSSGSGGTTPDGHYRVRRGDSLHAIAFRFGLDWREIARLNGISSPYVIYPDQILRLTAATRPAAGAPAEEAPGRSSQVRISTAPAPSSSTTKTAEIAGSTTGAAGEPAQRLPAETPATELGEPVAQARAGASAGTGTRAPAGIAYSAPAGDPGRWLWPTQGRLLSTFRANDPASKGIDIGGETGQPVMASAAGQVVYSGSGLIGYGELIIIKHSDRMLSAYAHNSKRLVSEGQQVTAGSQIAEMGTNDRNQAILHFEIRVNGKPEDPLKYLPRR